MIVQVVLAGTPVGAIPLAVLSAIGAVLVWMSTSAAAQVVAYRQAPSNQQPNILQTANGGPQVNIQTSSAVGVSHNVYNQFDVQSNGVTLSSVRGQVASNSNVELLIGTQLNTYGVISAAKDLNLSAGFSIAQPSRRTELNNTRGLIQATAGSLNLNVGNIDNTQGSVYAHHDLSLISTGAIVNTGFIAAQGNTTLSANSLSKSARPAALCQSPTG